MLLLKTVVNKLEGSGIKNTPMCTIQCLPKASESRGRRPECKQQLGQMFGK